MAITAELREKFGNHKTRDEVMLDIARHYIGAPGVETDEMVQLFQEIPCLNDREQSEVETILLRALLANDLLPQAKDIFSVTASIYGAPKKIEEQTNPTLAFRICHSAVCQAEQLAETMNSPVRETIAALARVGTTVAIHFILTDDRPETRGLAKANLLYFSLIEMLSLGTKTNAFQYCYTDPDTTTSEFFAHLDSIRPVIALRPGADERKFKGSVAFGETPIDRVIPIEGREFYYVGE